MSGNTPGLRCCDKSEEHCACFHDEEPCQICQEMYENGRRYERSLVEEFGIKVLQERIVKLERLARAAVKAWRTGCEKCMASGETCSDCQPFEELHEALPKEVDV